MSVDDHKIVFLRLKSSVEPYYHLAVEGYTAEIPSGNDPIQKLTVRGPIIIEPGYNGSVQSRFGGIPSYDSDKHEIVWPVYTNEKKVAVWRIGKHFVLNIVEETPITISGMNHYSSPTLVLENGTATAGAAAGGALAVMRREPQKQKWEMLKFNSTYTGRFAEGMVLYKPTGGEYVFLLKIDPSRLNILHIDQIHESKLAELQNNDQIRWQHFEVDMGFELKDTPFTAYVPDTSGKGRLYIFKCHSSYGGINYAYVPLRTDGSIDSYQASLKALNVQRVMSAVGSSQSSLKVLQSGQRLLLLWDNNFDHPDDPQVYGHSGIIKSDGSIPNADEWQEVTLTFETKPAPERNSSWSALVTPNEFDASMA